VALRRDLPSVDFDPMIIVTVGQKTDHLKDTSGRTLRPLGNVLPWTKKKE
jgi:hypothetical protein